MSISCAAGDGGGFRCALPILRTWPVSTNLKLAVAELASERDILRSGMEFSCPRIWEDMAMRFLSLFVARLAVSILSIALLLCGLSGTAMSRTATPSGGATTSLPDVVVEAPKQAVRLQKPKQHAVARSTVPPTTPTPSASTMSPAEKLPNVTGSCTGGCATSFRSGNAPWVGCSGSGWPALSSTCRNMGNWKTYAACMDDSLKIGWKGSESTWYCSSLRLK